MTTIKSFNVCTILSHNILQADAHVKQQSHMQDKIRKMYLLPWKCREQKRQVCANFSSARSLCCWSKTSL